jgi:hypothetical protein
VKTEKYIDQKKRLPESGRQVIGYLDDDNITVYQAYNDQIAEYVVKHQQFRGPHYSFNRMSWIKPGFLWMMHRAGWAMKENQQRILAIVLPIRHFKTILKDATITSFDDYIFPSQEEWKKQLDSTEVRLQWDPDHDPFGNKEARKASDGMKGEVLISFGTKWIKGIEDITSFVRSEYEKVLNNSIVELIVPFEEVLELHDEEIEKRIGIQKGKDCLT